MRPSTFHYDCEGVLEMYISSSFLAEEPFLPIHVHCGVAGTAFGLMH
jgi:hypothetical protein